MNNYSHYCGAGAHPRQGKRQERKVEREEKERDQDRESIDSVKEYEEKNGKQRKEKRNGERDHNPATIKGENSKKMFFFQKLHCLY